MIYCNRMSRVLYCGLVLLVTEQIPELLGQPEKDLVKEALQKYRDEEVILESRRIANIDLKIAEYKTLTPAVMPANTAPLSPPAGILRASRIINRIHSFSSNFTVNLEDSMKTQTARMNDVQCPFLPVPCELMPGRFRTYDGRCNNRLQPLWGAAYTPFVRQVQAAYESDDSENGYTPRHRPRRHGVGGELLPSARHVSNLVHMSSNKPIGASVTSLYTTFGQSLSHDVSDTPVEKGFGGSKLSCCNQSIPTDRCFNIDIPPGDFFRLFDRSCMPFARSVEVTDLRCETGQREQLNIASAFVDLTQVYGHTAEHAQILKGENGQLKYSFPNNLPYQSHPNTMAFQQGIHILLSGDEKTGEFPGLTAINALLMREHNRIATHLMNLKRNAGKGPRYADLPEDIYQTTRKIMIGIMQHITYSEYLPLTIGAERMARYDLYPQQIGYYSGYDSAVNPSISNVFSTAAMRFGHSMVRNNFSLLGEKYRNTQKRLRLKKIYWRTNFFTKYEDGLQRGVLVDDSEMCDRHIGDDLRNHMFETRSGNGMDLAALNIQRGRDHGLPSYNQYRRQVGLSPATEWSVHPDRGFRHMTQDVVNQLKAAYRFPEDVDVWSGGVSETPLEGAQVGPLFAEILARQFQKLRKGDFYWYENPSNGLTEVQLMEIRNYSLAKMICNNSPVDTIQPRVFELHTVPGNARVHCNTLSDLNFYRW